LQWDEEKAVPADDFYGGAGYDSKSRPDLSNTQLFLDALARRACRRMTRIQKALTFVSAVKPQGENNDQPWAGKINDGSFIYSPAAARDQGHKQPDGGPPATAA